MSIEAPKRSKDEVAVTVRHGAPAASASITCPLALPRTYTLDHSPKIWSDLYRIAPYTDDVASPNPEEVRRCSSHSKWQPRPVRSQNGQARDQGEERDVHAPSSLSLTFTLETCTICSKSLKGSLREALDVPLTHSARSN